MRRTFFIACAVLALLAAACGSSPSSSPNGERSELRVMAAASLTEAFDELGDAFMDTPQGQGSNLVLTLGGSATLATQVEEGAPVDVVALADTVTMQRVLVTGRFATDPQHFATNSLLLVTPPDNPASIAGPGDLERQDIVLALCNEAVPCGRLTIEAAAALRISLEPDTFQTSVRGVLTKVELGEVDAGLVYITDAIDRDVQTFSLGLDPPPVNRYPIVAMTNNPAALTFVDFVLSAEGQQILASYGFGAP